MAVKQEYIDIMVNIQGFSVGMVGTVDDPAFGKTLMIELKRRESLYRCRCEREFNSVYDSRERSVRDLSYGPWKRVWLVFYQVRVRCPDCGVVTEKLDWVDPLKCYTRRLAAAVSLACREMRSIKSVAEQFDLHWNTVKEMDKAALEEDLPLTSEYNPRVVGVDEFSIKKRHHYGTTVVDLAELSIPYVAEGRTIESLDGFYDSIGREKCKKIEAVCMDMWSPYEEATRKHCPDAQIVYDPFHVIAAYGREVVDKVRVEETRKAQGKMLDFIKGSRYLLLKNKENLDPCRDEPARLSELLRLNRRLNKVYVLKDDLKQLWNYRMEAWMMKWFKGWYNRAILSRIEPLKKFAKRLKKRIAGILAHCHLSINNGFIEGVNNKIKVIKRVAFGFRDLDYFFLKIRGAFWRPIHTEK